MRAIVISLCFLTTLMCVDAQTRESAPPASSAKTIAGATAPAPQAATVAAPDDPATRAFTRGADLLERNCGECYPSSREGMAEGIASLQRALQLGYPDRAAAHRLLVRAYADMTFAWYGSGEPEKARYRQLWRAEIAELARLDPSDLDNLLLNVRQNSGGEEQRVTALRALVEEHPQYAAAEYELAVNLLALGSDEEAVRHAQRWLNIARDGQTVRRGSIDLLSGIDAERLRGIVAAAPAFHPARYALGLRLVAEGVTQEGFAIGRTAVQDAPPSVAAEYVEQLATALEQQKHPVESESLRSEFRDKVRKGESRRDQ
jgi:tetratricopeptide (TPR) repeat protein